ncbi:MAG: discoidin domain-containing protein [Rhodospirillaceae bacterium]|nr:discoidin domain-containing protein [Rhodospirillaceae bacterium]
MRIVFDIIRSLVSWGLLPALTLMPASSLAQPENAPSNLICQEAPRLGWTVCATTVRLPLTGKKLRDPSIDFHPRNVADGDPKTAWAPGQPGLNLGNTLKVYFGKKRRFRYLSLWNGYSLSAEAWIITGRLREILIQTSDGLYDRARLVERNGAQVIALSRPVEATWMRVIALVSRPGEIYWPFAISELSLSNGVRGVGVPLVIANRVDDWLPEFEEQGDKEGRHRTNK